MYGRVLVKIKENCLAEPEFKNFSKDVEYEVICDVVPPRAGEVYPSVVVINDVGEIRLVNSSQVLARIEYMTYMTSELVGEAAVEEGDDSKSTELSTSEADVAKRVEALKQKNAPKE